MTRTLYRFLDLEIAVDEGETFYLIRGGQVVVYSRQWQTIVAAFFNESEDQVCTAMHREHGSRETEGCERT